MKTRQINFRADNEDQELLAAICKKTGLSRGAAIRLGIRRLAELEKISPKKGTTK